MAVQLYCAVQHRSTIPESTFYCSLFF